MTPQESAGEVGLHFSYSLFLCVLFVASETLRSYASSTTPAMTLNARAPSAMLLFVFLLPSLSLAASSAIATSAIVSTYTSTIYKTTSSIVSSSISVGTTGKTCNTTTDTSGSFVTQCVSGTSASEVPVYADVVETVTTTIESTIGYSPVYSYAADAVSLPLEIFLVSFTDKRV